MKKLLVLFISLTALVLSGCKKNSAKPGGGSNDTYQPVTTGSTWNYKQQGTSSEGGSYNYTLTQTMTDKAIVLNHNNYRQSTQVYSNDPTNTGYLYYGYNNHFYSFAYNDSDTQTDIEVPYLKDDAAVGDTWTWAVNLPSSLNTVERIVGTLVEKNITFTVSGKTYSNVMHTKVDDQVQLNGSFQTATSTEYYIAKNIGIISRVITDYNSQGLSSAELVDYTIK